MLFNLSDGVLYSSHILKLKWRMVFKLYLNLSLFNFFLWLINLFHIYGMLLFISICWFNLCNFRLKVLTNSRFYCLFLHADWIIICNFLNNLLFIYLWVWYDNLLNFLIQLWIYFNQSSHLTRCWNEYNCYSINYIIISSHRFMLDSKWCHGRSINQCCRHIKHRLNIMLWISLVTY